MENQFYYKQNGLYFGPCDISLIQKGYEQKQLKPMDLVMDPDNGYWYPVGHYLGQPLQAPNPLETVPSPVDPISPTNMPRMPRYSIDKQDLEDHDTDMVENDSAVQEPKKQTSWLYFAGLFVFAFGVLDFCLGNFGNIDMTGVSWSPIAAFVLGGFLMKKSSS